ncbi:hypothetical protein CLV91_3256 [Maribacter vaceletii]|uniref:Uncharacterized protein n=1 Tax=Maribacter vaceletii TaxID=1206816 RepID=A0A495DSB5_9FLAO|nr:hypothetical protein [Maribacter vaceletii]RKR07026.1 hypothetical protein CLV91_3256 [Maribacter vaceletii]
MKLKSLKFIGILFLGFVLLVANTSCTSLIEDEVDNQKEEEEKEEVIATMTAEVNGEAFESYIIGDGESVSATINILSTGGYLGAISGFDFTIGLKRPKAIIFYFIGGDYEALSNGEIYNTITPDFLSSGAYAWYTQNNGEEEGNEGFGDNKELEEVYVKITSIDKENKLLSGEFNYKGTSSVTGKKYAITNGKFSNVLYVLDQE